MDIVKAKTGLFHGICGNPTRRAGGIALLWRKYISFYLLSYSNRHVDGIIYEDGNKEWRFTGLYGWSEKENKKKTGELLNFLGSQFDLPWVICGDFNWVLYLSEKQGGKPFDVLEAHGFHTCLNIYLGPPRLSHGWEYFYME